MSQQSKMTRFGEVLQRYPIHDRKYFDRILAQWKNDLIEGFLTEPIEDTVEAFVELSSEAEINVVTDNQKKVLRILVNILFLEKFGRCWDDPSNL